MQGEFIFGFDCDIPDIFKRTVDFAIEAKLGAARFAILKPYPGKRIYDSFVKEGRLKDVNWENFHTQNVVYEAKGLTSEELSFGRDWAYKEFASISSIYKRVGFRKKYSLLFWLINLGNTRFNNKRGHIPPVFSS